MVSIEFGEIVWNKQHDELESVLGPIRQAMFEYLVQFWGERCPDFNEECSLCQKWKAFDCLTENPFNPEE
jgi:hypothetical protein